MHDGPNAAFYNDYVARTPSDSRIRFSLTERRTGDMGNSQRMQVLSEAAAKAGPDDYCVLWDDDNYFHPGALSLIAETLAGTGYPDLLLVPLKHRGKVLPPADKKISELARGDLDSGCFVLRAACYESIRPTLQAVEDCYLFDLTLFKAMRTGGGAVVGGFAMPPVGEYDGLHASVGKTRATWVVYWLSLRRIAKAVDRLFRRLLGFGLRPE